MKDADVFWEKRFQCGSHVADISSQIEPATNGHHDQHRIEQWFGIVISKIGGDAAPS